MDLAYDHILESSFPEEPSDSHSADKKSVPQATLNEDLQDAYRAISSSPWGARIGGFFGTVVKQVCYPGHDSTTATLTVCSRADLSTAKPNRSSRLWARTPRAA
jgi:hypothetical protein